MSKGIMWPRWRYLILALAFCAIPLLHYRNLDAAIEELRPPLALLPVEAILLKQLGKLAGLLSIALAAAWVLSAKVQTFRNQSTALWITTGTLVFALFYGFWSSFVLWIALAIR